MFPYSVYQTRNTNGAAATTQDGITPTGTNTYYSDAWKGDDDFSVQVMATGTLTGTFTVWGSNKLGPALGTDADWTDITAAAGTVANPAAGPVNFVLNNVSIRMSQVRLKYVQASGTGTITARADIGNRR